MPAKQKLAEQFPNIKIRSRVRRSVRARSLIVAPLAAAKPAPIIIVVVVFVAVSLSTTNCPIAGNAELLRTYRNLP